jgi:putative endonuclease
LTWFVYLLRCSDNSLYCGVTNDLQKRVEKHSTGKGAKYTRSRLPVELVWQSAGMDKSTAHKAEYYVKKHSKRDKEDLALGCGHLNEALLQRFKVMPR